jgi:hypothetical protein
MNQPIKVIHKYKNINRKIQYNVLIFIGNLLSESTNKVLKKIKDKNLYNSLIELNDRDLEILNKEYGVLWYKNFFINKHIENTFNNIIAKNESKKKEIITKYGKEWYKNHIEKYNEVSKIIYSYQTTFKYEKELKAKLKNNKDLEKNDNTSYKTNLNNLDNEKIDDMNIEGGSNITNSEFIKKTKNRIKFQNDIQYMLNKKYSGDKFLVNTKEIETETEIEDIEDIEEIEETEEMMRGMDMDNRLDYEINEFNLEELENYNKEDVELDKNVDEINKSLKELIDKTEIEIKDDKFGQITKWDESKDYTMYDENLINIYSKVYIYNQYICIDDTIKIIKNKICCGYEKSKIFNKSSPYFIPSRLYLWSEYEYFDFNNILKIDKIMLGQKWIKKYELLEIDIEPNDNIRVYETLKGNLKYLQENIKKYATKITYENDEQNILNEYSDYIINNEIYMIDLYNELGLNYQVDNESLKNIYDVYIKIYYFGISQDVFKNILDYLNTNKSNNKSIEGNKINLIYKNMNNDLLMDNEILKMIEELKKTPSLYDNIFKDNYVTQSVIHMTIKHKNFKNSLKIELYRIFDHFVVDDKYPFIQFQTSDGKLIFKYHSLNKSYDKEAILSKWFENSPYGISFKIAVDQKGGSSNKYISINLNENGRIEYKTQWKEDDHATIQDIENSYEYVRQLLKKINEENSKLKLEIPKNNRFKFAFINTIQQFELPNNYFISHNDLSDFARYFYPYISIVVEPKKRQSKIIKKNDKSKYGTYLRYKRISKYDNESNIEKKILYFLRNYESNDKLLILEIAKQFNITDKLANEKINNVINKYPNIKKSRNILKKFENVPKFKPPGIGIDIQGKARNKYKMRINGARSKKQLNIIIEFMNILIYLYIETYLYKNKDKQIIKEKLKELINIAKRRNKVDDVFEFVENIKTVKQITKIDKERLAYKPEKGQNQWTRNCQNSGDDKKRRPLPYTNKTLENMINSGYIFNSNTGNYEKTIEVKENSKINNVTLQAAKIDNYDGEGNTIYYTCDPKENGDYMYIGFLSRSANPFGLCMPCCFKKDPGISNNKQKREYHMRCLGKLTTDNLSNNLNVDKLYILQDTNKIQHSRYGFLPDYLDLFLNTMLNKEKTIKNNYITASETGWIFKYGTKQDDDIYLTVVANALNTTVEIIKDKITEVLLNETNSESIFTSLNNGDIKTQFGTIEYYIRYIHTNFEIEYNLIADILSIPGVIYEYGLNTIIFEKKTQYIQNEFDKKTLKDDFNVIYTNAENIYYLTDINKFNLLILKEDNNLYPLYQIKKKEDQKIIILDKLFKYDNTNNNVINHIYEYIKINYLYSTFDISKIDNAKTIFTKLNTYGLKDYFPTKQIIDKRNKCKYFVIQNKYLFPIKPSGSLYWIPIEYNYENYIHNLNDSSDIIYNIYLKSNKNINTKQLGISFSSKTDQNYTVDSIIIDNHINIPIKQTIMNYDNIIEYAKKYKIKDFYTESKSIYDIIDKDLIKYNNFNNPIDKRIIEINKDNYINEGYELFRLEISYYLKDQDKLKEKIIKLLSKKNINNTTKKIEIKKIIYKIVAKKLYDIYINSNSDEYIDDNNSIQEQDSTDEIINDDSSEYLDDTDLIPINIIKLLDDKYNDVFNENQIGSAKNDDELINLELFVNPNKKLVHIDEEIPNVDNYIVNNNREICPTNIDKKSCNINKHCIWSYGNCLFKSTSKQIIKYINKITEELVNNELKSNEILLKDNYFVSDINNIDFFTNRPNQKIIRSNNNNIKKILSEIFGKNNIPIIGKRRINKISKNINNDNITNSLETIGNLYIQTINPNNTIYRAYANCFFWIKNNILDISHRNLGYYNPLQTDLSNFFKSQVIDWIINKKNQIMLLNDLEKIIDLNRENSINDFKKYLTTYNDIFKSYIIDLYILSKINNKIIYLHDNFNNIIGVFDNGLTFLSNYTNNYNFKKIDNSIHIKYNINVFSLANTPNIISSIYY